MAVRNDLTIDWDASPRIIYVDSPSVEITIQDLHDSCRFYESQPTAMDNPTLIDTAGLEELGGGTYVGLTATLQNALVAFEARTGPTYEQCRVNGGNLVALDDVGAAQKTPIYPTAFTQVVTTASSSATTQSQAQLEYSTFNGGVTLDQANGTVGTQFPQGTGQAPVNNLPDAQAIALENGFNTIFVKGTFVFAATDVVSDLSFEGASAAQTVVVLTDAASITDCVFTETTLLGYWDGGNDASECIINGIDYVDGNMLDCLFTAAHVKLSGTQANILRGGSGVAGGGPDELVTFDLEDSGCDVIIRDWHGGLKIINNSVDNDVSMDMSSGRVTIDSTISAGTYTIRGIADVIDNSTGTAVVNDFTVNKKIDDIVLGGGGATPQQIWEYSTRELTTDTGISQGDKDEIKAGVWTEPSRTLTEAAGVTPQDISDISDAVWTAVTRSLTTTSALQSSDIPAIADAIWDEDVTTHTGTNSAGERLTINLDIGDISNISSAVWGVSIRTLTSTLALDASDISTIAAGVWAEPSRTITGDVAVSAASSNALAADVWQNVSRDLTAPVDVSISSIADISTDVWAETIRTLTSSVALTGTDLNNIAAEVWNETSRTLTQAPLLQGADLLNISDAIWDEGAGNHVTVGTMGHKMNNALDTIDTAAISTAVWSEGSRELTSVFSLSQQDINSISAAIWNVTIDNYQSVGSAGEALIDASNSTDIPTLSAAIWGAGTRTLTATLAPSSSEIATNVWSEVSRTLTQAPSLLSGDIATIVTDIWANPGRTLTSTLAPTAADIATEVWGNINRTLTASNDPDANAIASAVWNAGTRDLTENVFIHASSISDISTDVWTETVRTLTDNVSLSGATLSSIASSVWLNTTRDLTEGVDINAPSIASIQTSVWSATVRDLTATVDISSQTINNISDDIWSAASRTLTDTGLDVAQTQMLLELWQFQGLDISNPVTSTQSQTLFAGIDVQYTGNSKTAVTAQRQP